MKRTRPMCLFLLLMALALARPAFAGGNANFVLGGRQLDKDFWEPMDEQSVFQATVDFGKKGWPIHLAVGVGTSAEEKDNQFNPFTATFDKLTRSVSELSFGVMKIWEPRGNIRPFVGGGLSSVTATFEDDNPTIGKITQDDTSPGFYVQGGVFWRIGTRFNIGLEARMLRGTDISIGGADGDADYDQFGLVLGWGWPPRR